VSAVTDIATPRAEISEPRVGSIDAALLRGCPTSDHGFQVIATPRVGADVPNSGDPAMTSSYTRTSIHAGVSACQRLPYGVLEIVVSRVASGCTAGGIHGAAAKSRTPLPLVHSPHLAFDPHRAILGPVMKIGRSH
jgi:hypothetical protein